MLAVTAWGLSPDEILLVVNRNVPEGVKLAEFYRAARNIPAGHVAQLDLPGGEDIAFLVYEQNVVPPLRQFLRANGLDHRIRCVVTFYGVPLRIGPRTATPAELEEVAELDHRSAAVLVAIKAATEDLEVQARRLDPEFVGKTGDDLDDFAARATDAVAAIQRQGIKVSDPAARRDALAAMFKGIQQLGGVAHVLRLIGQPGEQQADASSRQALEGLAREIESLSRQIAALNDRRFDSEARARTRQLVQQGFGLLELARTLAAQREYLVGQGKETVAAFDSELSLLWWNFYRRNSWQPNPLNSLLGVRSAQPTLMVTRLDAPQSGMVRDIILAGLKAEKDGLKGKMVLDSRAIKAAGESAKFGQYGWYDQGLRNLAELVRTRTKLGLLHDDSPATLPANAAQDVALYCGWYAVRNYVPCCRFNAGAVAFHVASFELVSLRNSQEKGWVKGLLEDGVAASLGSVAEPYLPAFPPADEFFPLLMTGRLTLAEVYWNTVPFSSWMMAIIGDPLYTPYKVNPQLKVEDLPPRLRAILDPPTTRPVGAGN